MSTSSPLRAVGYIRVSTDDQAREGLSLDVQRRAIADYCVSHDWDLLDIYADEGVTGAEWYRPGLQAILSQLPYVRRRAKTRARIPPPSGRPFDALVVFRLDRLSRDEGDIYEILRRLDAYGVAFRSATEPQYDDPDYGRDMLGISSVFAARVRKVISANVKAAMRDKSERGEWVGRTPFGYRMVEKQLVPDEEPRYQGWSAARLVPEVFRWYVEEQAPMQECGRRLTTITQSGPSYNAWSASDIARMLRKATYLGLIPWNDRLLPGKHQPLIPKDLWERANAILAHRRGQLKRVRVAGRYLLSGILRCRLCGAPMTGHWHRYRRPSGPYEYGVYDCAAKASHLATCKGSYVSVRKAENLVIEALGALSRATTKELRELPHRPAELPDLARIRRELEQIPARRQRLVAGFERGLYDEAAYRQQQVRIEHEEKQLRAALAGAQRRAPPAIRVRRRFRDLAELLRSELPFERKRRLLGELLESVVIGADSLPVLTFRL